MLDIILTILHILGLILSAVFALVALLTLFGLIEYTVRAFRYIKIGKLDINSWDMDDYTNWYKTLILQGEINKDSALIFRAATELRDCYWEKRFKYHKHVKGL